MIYSSFLEHHLNYINWIKSVVLHGSDLIAHVFGFPSHIEEGLTLKVYDRAGVNLNFTCLGLGLCSFWIAFVTAHISSWQNKLYWCFVGVLSICFINSWRIALLLISMEKNWNEVGYLNHHDMFNLASYTLLFFLIYLYSRKSKTQAIVSI
jgi:exosortase/archaeosortase family protein